MGPVEFSGSTNRRGLGRGFSAAKLHGAARSHQTGPAFAAGDDARFLLRAGFTIDKLRAELPGGNIGHYLNHDTGFSAYVVRRMGLDMDEFREAVANADNETQLVEWLKARVDPAMAETLNAKLETFVVERMTPEDQALVRQRHPVMALRPELSKVLDVLEADDEHWQRQVV